MLVKDLPQDIKYLVIKHNIKENGRNTIREGETVGGAFTWSNTPEGGKIWYAVQNGNFRPFRQFHHNKLKVGDTVEYFKPIEQEDWDEFGIASVSCLFNIGDKLKLKYVSGNDNCVVSFENRFHSFPSHCFRKVEVVEKPKEEPKEEPHPFKKGDKVKVKQEFKDLLPDETDEFYVINIIDEYSYHKPHKLEKGINQNVIFLEKGYGGWYLAECFELYVEKPKEEPVQEPIENFKVGDKVFYYRKPTKEEWKVIGEVGVKFSIGYELTVEKTYSEYKSLTFKEEIARNCHYPASCFRKITKLVLPEKWCINCVGSYTKYPELYEWRKTTSYKTGWGYGGYMSNEGRIYGDKFDHVEITYDQFIEHVYKPWKAKQPPQLLYIDPVKTTISEVPEYWYFPLKDCTADELVKFNEYRKSKASRLKENSLFNHHILLNYYFDESYYYISGIDSLKKSSFFKESTVELTKEEFYRLIYNPWQDEQSKSGKIIEKIEPSSAHAVTETDEIIITSLKRKSKLRLLSTNVENLDVKLTTLKPQKQKV